MGDFEYIDPRGNLVFVVDHARQEVIHSHQITNELDSEVEPFRLLMRCEC